MWIIWQTVSMSSFPTSDLDKLACTWLLERGLCTPAEAARLSGRSRQIARHWAGKGPGHHAREEYLKRQFARVKRKLDLSNDADARKEGP